MSNLRTERIVSGQHEGKYATVSIAETKRNSIQYFYNETLSDTYQKAEAHTISTRAAHALADIIQDVEQLISIGEEDAAPLRRIQSLLKITDNVIDNVITGEK